MHISEGILPISHAAAWAAAAAPVIVFSTRGAAKLVREGTPEEKALFGMASALIFAVTMFPIPVPVAGATSHLCITPLAGIWLGPGLAALPALVSLTLQALFLGHGGITSLGANTLTLGIVGPGVAFVLARAFKRLGFSPVIAIAVACATAQVAVYAADSAILALALAGSKPFSFWFARVALAFAPIQLPLAVLEGVLSAVLVRSVASRRPLLLPVWLRGPFGRVPSVAAAAAVVLVLSASPALAAEKERWAGADEVVMDAAALEAGRKPRPVYTFPSEEIEKLVFSGFLFGAGVLAGTSWQRLRWERGGNES